MKFLAVHDGMFSHVARVYPGHEDYDSAHESLEDAKADVLRVLQAQIGQLQACADRVEYIELADVPEEP